MEVNENENTTAPNLWDAVNKGGYQRELYSNPGLPKKGRKVSNTQPNLTPKKLEKEQQIKLKTNKRRESIISK